MSDEIDAVFAALDDPSKSLDLHAVANALATVRASHGPGTPENVAAWVEMVPFNLMVEAEAQAPFYGYFGPISSVTYENGEVVYSPDPRQVPPEGADAWAHRRDTVKHPILVARYADLLWELGSVLFRQRRDPENARTAINAYLAASDAHLYDHPYEQATGVLRALSLAIQLNDSGLKTKATQALLVLHDESITQGGLRYHDVVERLLRDRNISLTDAERAKVIAGLEAKLAETTDPVDGAAFNPFEAKDIGDQLAKHYRRGGYREAVVRVRRTVGAAFEASAAKDPGLAASAHLDSALEAYAGADDKAAVERVRIAKVEAVQKSVELMAIHEVTHEIPVSVMDDFIARLVSDDLARSLLFIANRFVDRVSVLERWVRKMAQEAPLQALIAIQIMEDDHVAAVVGSVEEDIEGRLMHEAGHRLSFDEVWLDRAFERLMEIHRLNPNDFVGWANRLGAFPEQGLLRAGVEAWERGDWVKAMHVLVPQIEVGLRETLRSLGGAIVKPHPQGGGREVLLSMGEILGSERLAEAMGRDLIHYFRATYSDPRGWNLRNAVAHGLAGLGRADSGTCNRLMHSLLVLGGWKDIAAARVKVEQQEAAASDRDALAEG